LKEEGNDEEDAVTLDALARLDKLAPKGISFK